MSTPTENAELVRRGYAAFNTADMPALNQLFDAEATWHTPGQSPIAGDFLGRDATFGQFGRYAGGTAGTFRAELQDVAASDEGRVIARHRNTGTRNGKQLDVECCVVFEIKDGRLISAREHFYDLHAWDAFWA